MFYFIFITKKKSPKNYLCLIFVFYRKLCKVSCYYYVSTNSITLWILLNLGGSWWWIPIVDPSGSPLWILVDPHYGSWRIPIVDPSGSRLRILIGYCAESKWLIQVMDPPGGSPLWILADLHCGSQLWILVDPHC